jgi:muramidase (phage lysozyme)
MTDNERAFLYMIRACEGTLGDEGYQALFGWTPANHRIFDNNFATHPHIYVPYTTLDGVKTQSSAAGAYQIIWATFCDLQAKLGTTDFSPPTQDLMALRLIADCGALPDIAAGNLQAAIDACSTTWASLPGSQYAEPKKSYAFALGRYNQGGGAVA